MKQIILATFLVATPLLPATAQESSETDTEDGFNLMEEGARMLLRGLMTEMEPAIDDLRDTFDEMGPAFAEFAQSVGPAFAELLEQVDDIRNYEAPEILPNGDIIIRRSPDAPVWVPDAENGEVEL